MFDPLAEVTQHIPDAGEHLIRYHGSYSNKTRGQRQPSAGSGTGIPTCSPTARGTRKGWAALIQQVYQTDPICCPKYGAELKIIAFIERRQTEVIEKILRHCGLCLPKPRRRQGTSPRRVPHPRRSSRSRDEAQVRTQLG